MHQLLRELWCTRNRQFVTTILHPSSNPAAHASHPAGYLEPGYFFNGTAAELCPMGSVAPGVRVLAEGGACTPCPDGSDTAGLEGQTECQGDSVQSQ